MLHQLNKLLRYFPSRMMNRVALGMLRFSSSEFRAFTDIFLSKYEANANWQSGLGDAHYILYGVVRMLRPRVVVEIGSARGKSTCTLALACKQNGHGKIYAIDPHTPNAWSDLGVKSDSYDFLMSRLRAYWLNEWCEVIATTSQVAAQKWSCPIDLLFIDGDHTYEGVKHDFEAFKPWLSEHAIVLFHDSHWEYIRDNPYYREDCGVPRYLSELQREGYHSVPLYPPPGITLLFPRPGGCSSIPQDEARNKL